jgi:hypothetical protein
MLSNSGIPRFLIISEAISINFVTFSATEDLSIPQISINGDSAIHSSIFVRPSETPFPIGKSTVDPFWGPCRTGATVFSPAIELLLPHGSLAPSLDAARKESVNISTLPLCYVNSIKTGYFSLLRSMSLSL